MGFLFLACELREWDLGREFGGLRNEKGRLYPDMIGEYVMGLCIMGYREACSTLE